MRDVLGIVFLSVLAVMTLTLSGCGDAKGGGGSPSPSPSPSPSHDCGNRCVVTPTDWAGKLKVPLSFAIKTHNMVYASGMPGFDMNTLKLVPGGIKAETTQSLQNIAIIVEAAGTSMDAIVSCQVAMANITRDFKEMNAAYAAFFPKNPPSRTAVQVAKMEQGALVEIQCIAAAKGADHSVVPMKLPPGLNMTIPLSAASMSSDIIYASGVQGRDGMKIVPGGIKNETTAALASLEATLSKAGSDPGHVVACTVYISDMAHFADMNEAYKAFWPKDAALGGFPSRICVEASEIAGGANVEITCTAVSNKKGVDKPKVITVPGWPPMTGFPLSTATVAGGIVFASGMQGMNTTTMKLVDGGIGPETTQTMKNIEAMFKAAGADLAKGAVECEVYLRDLKDYEVMNKAYSAFWGKEGAPARMALQVAGLAGTAAVEIKCTGVVSTTVTVESQDEIVI